MLAREFSVLAEAHGTEAAKAWPDNSGSHLDSVLRSGSSGCPTIFGRLCLFFLDPPMVSDPVVTKEVVLPLQSDADFSSSHSLEPSSLTATTSGREPGR